MPAKIFDNKRFALVIGFIIWGLLVLGGYYLIHKPFTSQQATSIAIAILDIALALGLSILAGAIGRRLLPASRLSNLVRFGLQAALGWGVLSLFWFIVGLLGLYQVWFAWLIMVAGLVLLRRDALEWMRELSDISEIWTDANTFGRLLAAGCVLLLGIQLSYALAPPFKWDSLAYHLELPRQYLAAGKFLFLVENPLWGRSQITELLYTWAMALRGWETAIVLAWFFSFVLLIGVLGFVRRHTNATCAWVAVTALMAGYTFRGMFSWGYLDGIAALYGFGVLVLLIETIYSRKAMWFLWLGVFIGLSLGVKFTNGLLLLVVFLTMMIFHREIRSRWLIYFLVICVISAALFMPWLLKNGLSTGNPLYPHLWPTEEMDEEMMRYYQGSTNFTLLNWHDIILPISLTWFGIEGAEIVGIERYYADIGPLLLLLAIPGLIYKRKEPYVKIVVIWLAAGWFSMVIGGRITPLLWQTRYYFSLLPAAALAVGWGWEAIQGISTAGIRLRRVAGVLVLLVLVMAIWQDTIDFVRQNPLGVVFGTQTKDTYLDKMLGYYAPATRALETLPIGSRVVLLWDERGLYTPINTQADELIDQWFVLRKTLVEPTAILKNWVVDGYTHLLIYQDGVEFERQNREALTYEDWEALDKLLASLPPAIEFGGVYELYSINP